MKTIDYLVVALFFLLMVVIGLLVVRKVKGSRDFFVGGGRVPWWLAGISHHVSGYSGVVFVGFASVAYQYGFTLYVWWALSIAIACLLGAWIFAPRWARLRMRLNIESPTEYLATRYNLAAQQLMAWSGVLLKLFDVGAKWASLGVLLHGFTGIDLSTAIIFSSVFSIVYSIAGGLWADLYTDFLQFLVQLVASFVLFFAVTNQLGGIESVWTLWDRLPAGHSQPFNGPYTSLFFIAYVLIAGLSYNGGTWNLAARYISAPSGESAKKSAILSSMLYLVWPLILFFPMWAAPVLLPNLDDPTRLYSVLTLEYLPAGLIGLVVAGMFACTMSMVTSDINTISAVITRDILPLTSRKFQNMTQRRALMIGRICTFLFTVSTLIVAIEAERFGGILGLVISWFGALIGPVSIPMLFGLLPAFKRATARTAIISIVAGVLAFVAVELVPWLLANLFTSGAIHDLLANFTKAAVKLITPICCSGLVFGLLTWLNRRDPVPAHIEQLMYGLSAKGEGQPAS